VGFVTTVSLSTDAFSVEIQTAAHMTSLPAQAACPSEAEGASGFTSGLLTHCDQPPTVHGIWSPLYDQSLFLDSLVTEDQ
jgi:hypothetical protein